MTLPAASPTATAPPTATPSPTPSPTFTTAPTATPSPTVSTPTLEPTAIVITTTELTALEPEVAPPTPPPVTPTTISPAQPARLVIPAIGLDLEPIPVGVDKHRVPVVPKHDAGWFKSSAMPGQPSNIVFWGHVLRWKDTPKVPAPFARIQELQPGAELSILTVNGESRRYRVTQQVWARPEEVEWIRPTATERVTLVSCIGDKVIREGTLTKEFRLITIAEPAE